MVADYHLMFFRIKADFEHFESCYYANSQQKIAE